MARLKAEIRVSKHDFLSDAEIRKRLRSTLREACRIVRDYAREHHWYSDRSGRLTRSIRYRTRETSKDLVGTVYQNRNEAFYGKFQTEGTGIYGEYHRPINLNKNGRFHGYYWARRKRWVGNPIVRGIRKRNIIGNAYSRNRERIRQMFLKEVKDMARGVKK